MFRSKLPRTTTTWKSRVLNLLAPFRRKRPKEPSGDGATVGLQFEILEDRILLSVTPQLIGNILDVDFATSGDAASVAIVGPNIRVFDGTANSDFAANAVKGINVHGNGQANQNLTLNSTVNLTGALTVTGLATVTVNGFYTVNSANLALSDTLTVASTATISSRHIASGDPLTALSIGNSGDLILAAPTIIVADSSRLLAGADSGFTAGNVTLTAAPPETFTTVLGLSNFTERSAAASITIGAATFTGQNITVTADAENGSTPAPSTLNPPPPPVTLALSLLQAALQPSQAAAMLSDAQATLSMGPNTVITAGGTVSLGSKAVSSSTTSNQAGLVGVSYGSSEPTASVALANGVSIVAGGAFSMTADVTNTLSVTTLVPAGGSVNVSLAYGLGQSAASATVANGAAVQAASATISSSSTNSFSTQAIAAGFNQSGSAGVGVGVAIGDYQSAANTTVGGHITTTGSTTISSQAVNNQNVTRSFGSIATPENSSSLLTTLQNYVSATNLPSSFNGNPISLTGAAPLSVGVGAALTIVSS